MKVICISGHAQHGKDSTALYLKDCLELDNCRVLITHYGDLLKYICRTFFEWDGVKNEVGRTLLQTVGTEIIRKDRPDYWVDFLADCLDWCQQEWDYVLLPDCRFPNEISKLEMSGFDVTHMRVIRPSFDNGLSKEQRNHPSETAMDNVTPDVYIHNSGDLNDLLVTVAYWVNGSSDSHQLEFIEFFEEIAHKEVIE